MNRKLAIAFLIFAVALNVMEAKSPVNDPAIGSAVDFHRESLCLPRPGFCRSTKGVSAMRPLAIFSSWTPSQTRIDTRSFAVMS